MIIRGAWVLTMAPDGALEDGAVHIQDGAIIAVGPYRELRRRHPEATVVSTAS